MTSHLSETPSRLTTVPSPGARDKLMRFAWIVVQSTVYRWSPVFAHGWRCSLLRLFGAKIRGRAYPYPSARIWSPRHLEMGNGSCIGPRVLCYCVAPVTLGDKALVSQGVHLCSATHDHRDPDFPLVVGQINIGEHAWVAADAFVGPGVDIGARAIVGARAVVMKDIAAGLVVVGNPATPVGK